MAQRPSRKTKEAAAIYMEILSHKLVNESKIDDDNISIDSFPELPNVKKTEQRENELKAQAKSTKDDTKEKPKIVSGEIENDNKSLSTLVEDTDITLKHLKVKSTSSGLPLKKNVEKADKSKLRKSNNEDTTSEDTKLTKVAVTSQSKEKSPEPTRTVEPLVDQIIKSDGKLMCKKQPEAKKMATIPRKKKLTRSKVLRTQKNESTAEKSVDATKAVALTTKNDLKTKNDGVSSSDSDHSTTSDVIFENLPVKQEISKGNKDESDGNLDTDDNSHHFYIPQKPTKHNFPKLQPGGNLQKTKSENKTAPKTSKSSDRLLETDDFKYKIPSSPSASSSSSAKLYKRQTQKQKIRPPESVTPIYVSDFPKKSEPAKLVEAPVFHPTDQEFQDPLEYIERIRHKAEQFGICRIVPPNSFKPECKVTDDMRFTAYNQYVHKMLHRWGPNFKELMAIRKYLETQNISLTHPPWIGGMEIDLPRLYQTVQTLGGLKEVIEKKKWPRVSELMKIPKSAQDRVTKLDDIYCKYLLPYDTLSPAEREKLFDEVETEWAKRESKGLLKAQQKFASQDTSTEGDSEPD
ncbi:hypothetical protein NQ318_010316 [Aromia moschata]|uniref:Protein Jumonji n=1 Tax=Aromia moschata TaxID=1265417 RepID=A0AAV8XIN6_9CUCU|nr:hypothetical protein NQ318_010316 [Aromia moschata]